jgi:hypothetical protein
VSRVSEEGGANDFATNMESARKRKNRRLAKAAGSVCAVVGDFCTPYELH